MKNKNLNIGNMVSSVIGVFIASFFTKYIWAPILLLVLSFYIINRIVKNKKEYITAAIAVQTGHFLWMFLTVIGLYILHKEVDYAWIDVLILAIGVVWIHVRLSLISISFLEIYQITAAFVNINTLINVINSNPKAALISSLVFHIMLRIAAVVLMILGYKKFRKNKEIIDLKNSSNSKDEFYEDKNLNNSSWLCICGTSNISTDKNCKRCEISRDFYIKKL